MKQKRKIKTYFSRYSGAASRPHRKNGARIGRSHVCTTRCLMNFSDREHPRLFLLRSSPSRITKALFFEIVIHVNYYLFLHAKVFKIIPLRLE